MHLNYSKGLHLLATIFCESELLLIDGAKYINFLNQQIDELELNRLHHYVHQFENGGYTGVICLTESHIAFHTWPEFGLLTLDIYLSNYQKDNSEKCRNLLKVSQEYFLSNKVEIKDVFR